MLVVRFLGVILALGSMMVGMRGRVLAWASGVVAVGVAAGLGVYFWVVGLDKADKSASVAGAFVGLAALVVSIYGVVREHRGAGASPRVGGLSVSDSTVDGGVTQVKGVTGNVRISGVGQQRSAPVAGPDPVPSSAAGSPPQAGSDDGAAGGQSVGGSQVGGEVTQVDRVGGDAEIDR
jgi:hypothetical protein